ncbi:MAG TPA: restriction endonuclease subunit S, partial [Verrucomicrobiae bacterium]|nr:restriction endonuclease subunit S [Verrucomicrobiae bacterium]
KERLIELLHEKRTALISHAVTRGLNPNAPKRDSGIPWLGQIPRHWDLVRLGRKIQLQRGVDITKDDQNEGSVPVVSSGGTSSFHDKALARGPGVVVGRKGTAGAVHYVESDYWPHDTTLYVKEFRGNHPRFVFYKLCTMDLASFDTGSANPTLNRNLIHPVFVAWPSHSEQAAIATYLDVEAAKLDALMAKVRTAIERLVEYRKALISAAVTGQIDVRSGT